MEKAPARKWDWMSAILLFLLAYELMSFSIERWFSAPAQQLMDDSRKIAAQYYEETRQQANTLAGTIAASLTADAIRVEERESLSKKLESACNQFRFESARLFNDHGRAVEGEYRTGAEPDFLHCAK